MTLGCFRIVCRKIATNQKIHNFPGRWFHGAFSGGLSLRYVIVAESLSVPTNAETTNQDIPVEEH